MGFDLISSFIFLGWGKLIMFSIIRVSGTVHSCHLKRFQGLAAASVSSPVGLCFPSVRPLWVALSMNERHVIGHLEERQWCLWLDISKSTEAPATFFVDSSFKKCTLKKSRRNLSWCPWTYGCSVLLYACACDGQRHLACHSLCLPSTFFFIEMGLSLAWNLPNKIACQQTPET